MPALARAKAVESILSLLAPGFLREQREKERRVSAQEERLSKIKIACASKPHGTRARYAAGCKCMLCRAANSRYETVRALARKNGDANPIVSADRARRHLAELSAKGIGRHSVHEACDVSEQILCAIIYGQRENIRARTERRILAVDEGARRGKCLMPAAPTWRLLRELLRDGYSKVQIVEWMGGKRALQIKHGEGARITAATAMKVERVYNLIQAGKLRRTR
jgi:hypothetical protein